MTPSYLSLHILADGCNETDLNRAGRFLAACECEYYNITTASRYNEAEKLIRLLRYQAPKARPIWRGWPSQALEDGGIWQRVKPQEWVNYRIAPNAKWLKELDVLVLPCNEVGVLGIDAQKWSEWEADCARLSHIQFEINLAMLRLSTGNPLETEYDNYNAQLQAAAEFDGVLSPNEYTSTRMEITNRWHVGRYRWIWKRQDDLKIKRSPIVIGEYGIARVNPDNSLDPYHGYGDLDVNVNDHLSIIKRDGLTYQADRVYACWFVMGHWSNAKGSFDVQNNEPLLAAVETEAKAGNLAMQPVKEAPTLPVYKKDIVLGQSYQLSMPGKIITAYIAPSISDRRIGTIPDHAEVIVLDVLPINGDKWLKVRYKAFSVDVFIQGDLVGIRKTIETPAIVILENGSNPAQDAHPSDLPPLDKPDVAIPPATAVLAPKGYVLNAAQIATLESWRAELSVSIATANERLAIIDSLIASVKV